MTKTSIWFIFKFLFQFQVHEHQYHVLWFSMSLLTLRLEILEKEAGGYVHCAKTKSYKIDHEYKTRSYLHSGFLAKFNIEMAGEEHITFLCVHLCIIHHAY